MKVFLCILVSLVLIAVSGHSASYSVNIPIGDSLIANQLDNGANTLDEVLPVVPDGSLIRKWNCGGFDQYTYDSLIPGWFPGGGTLRPGEGAFFHNPGGAFNLTFTGNRHAPVLPPPMPCGCNHENLVSRQTTNAPSSFADIMGFTPVDGTTLRRWSGGAYITYTRTGGAWSPSAPSVNLGESVFVTIPCSNQCLVVTCATNKTVECGPNWDFDPPQVEVPCCGTNFTVSVLSTAVSNQGPCLQLATRTWRITDCFSNSTTCSQTVTLRDSTRPVLGCPPNVTVQCLTAIPARPLTLAQFLVAGGLASDNCDTNLTYTVSDGPLTGSVCGGTIIRTHTVTDDCTNSASCQQIITVRDTIPPFVGCPANVTVQCVSTIPARPSTLAQFLAAGGLASDCDTNLTYSCSDGPLTGGVCGGTIIRTHTVTDDCTNRGICQQIITVRDTIPPEVTCASNKTVECGSPWSFDSPVSSDLCCGTNVTLVVTGTTTNVGPCGSTYTRTWRATDCCTNSTLCSQTVTVRDTTPPVLTCATNKAVECGTSWSFDPPLAQDNCGSFVLSLNPGEEPGGVGGTGTGGGTATLSGNALAVSLSFSGLSANSTAAHIHGPAGRGTNAAVLYALALSLPGATAGAISQTVTLVEGVGGFSIAQQLLQLQRGLWYVNIHTTLRPGGEIRGQIESNVVITVVNTVTNVGCGKTFSATRTWQAADACSNSTTCSQTVIARDTVPPVLTCASNKTVECGSAWTFDPPSAADSCCGSNLTVVEMSTVTNRTCPWVITRTWRVTDCCTNSAMCSQTVTVENGGSPELAWVQTYNSSEKPGRRASALRVAVDASGNVVVTGVAFQRYGDEALDSGDYYTAKYAAADGVLLWEKRYDGPASSEDRPNAIAVDGEGNVVVTGYSQNMSGDADYYTAKYAAADSALLWERRYNGPADERDEAKAIAVDANGNVVVTGSSRNGRDDDCYTAKYAAADGALLWEKRYNGPADWSWDEANAIATDASGNVVVTGSSADSSTVGGYQAYYTAKYAAVDGALLWEKRYNGAPHGATQAHAVAVDAAGNVAVTGYSYNTSGNFDYYTAKYAAADGALLWEKRYDSPGDPYDLATAVAVDASGNVVVTGSSGNGDDSDYYTAKYAAADGELLWEQRYHGPGNFYNRPNAIAVNGEGNVVVTGFSGNAHASDYYTAKYAAADGEVLWEKRYNGPGHFYNRADALALDASGNVVITGNSYTRTNWQFLTVKYNTHAVPVLTCPNNKTVPFGIAWTFDPPTVLDTCCGTNVDLVVTGTTTNTGPCFSAYTRTWRGTDCCTNSTTCSQTVTIPNSAAPVLVCPSGWTNLVGTNCQVVVPDLTGEVTVTDQCGPLRIQQLPPPGTVLGLGEHWITFTATSNFGESSTCTALFRVIDLIPPTLVCPTNLVVEVTRTNGAIVHFELSVADNCTLLPVVECVPPSGSFLPLGTTSVACTATDASSNRTSCAFTVTVRDGIPPIVQCPKDRHRLADASQQFVVPDYRSFVAAADESGPVTLAQTPSPGTVVGPGTYPIQITATDTFSNVTHCTFTLTVFAVSVFGADTLPACRGDRVMASHMQLAPSEQAEDVECWVLYSTQREGVENAALSIGVPKGRARLGAMDGNRVVEARFIFPHYDHPRPNIEDINPVNFGSGRTIYYQLLKKTSSATVRSEIRQFVMPYKITIGLFGDSFAAGEGAPEVVGPVAFGKRWTGEIQHRSKFGGFALAVEELKRSTPETAFLSKNVSCSGASLREGLYEPYWAGNCILPEGDRIFRREQEPQIEQIDNWLRGRHYVLDGRPSLNIAVISGGGNDINFGDLVKRFFLNLAEPRVFPPYASTDLTEKEPIPGLNFIDADTIRVELRKNIDEKLPKRYRKLRGKLDRAFNYDCVLVTEYPTILQRETANGFTFCGGNDCCLPGICQPDDCWGVFWGPVERQNAVDEVEWAQENFLDRMNNSIRDTVGGFDNWRFLDGIGALFRAHGICSSEPWANTFGMSVAFQGDFCGTMHPNHAGYAHGYRPVVLAGLRDAVAKIREDCDDSRAQLIVDERLRRRQRANEGQPLEPALELAPVLEPITWDPLLATENGRAALAHAQTLVPTLPELSPFAPASDTDYDDLEHALALGVQPRAEIHVEAGSGLVITWPEWASEMVVESATSLGADADWEPVIAPTGSENGVRSLRIEPDGTTRFIRLKQP